MVEILRARAFQRALYPLLELVPVYETGEGVFGRRIVEAVGNATQTADVKKLDERTKNLAAAIDNRCNAPLHRDDSSVRRLDDGITGQFGGTSLAQYPRHGQFSGLAFVQRSEFEKIGERTPLRLGGSQADHFFRRWIDE